MKGPRLKKITWILVMVGVSWIAGDLLANSAEQGQQIITLQTPDKKSGGLPTHVTFYHMRHVNEFGAQCSHCHPAIKATLNSPENSQKNVHETCRQCHAKNKPGKNFICSRCHRQ